ncbi:MAG: adenylyl-sulfate kinase, partial [Rhodobiaceae bacterium]|nr:adenylyl-sulfate kinase [Rhodobiaceae bacterium]
QYTRNMVTGASTAEVAVILIDARKGVLPQTRRHSMICSALGIKNVVVAINKMDLVAYERDVFDRILADYMAFANQLEFSGVTAIPMSALKGDNIIARSNAIQWYQGPTLLGFLETVDTGASRVNHPLRFPVQWVNRPNLDFRGFSGLIASGRVAPGDDIRVVPSGKNAKVRSIVTMASDGAMQTLDEAVAGQSVTLTLDTQIDCSRGDIIAAADNPPAVADRFEATLIWMDETPLLPGRSYEMKIGTQSVAASVQTPKYQVNVNTMEHLASKTLELNAIGVVEIATTQKISFAPYAENRALGSFVLIDKMSNATVAAGLLHFSLRRADNIHWQATDIDRKAHAQLKNQKPLLLWFTGLSGSGKSTIANELEKILHTMNRHTFLLDGDNVRHGLNKDLGFTDADRVENIRRIGEVSKLMVDAGLIVLSAFISPFRAERDMVREMLPEGEFIEIFVDTPLDVAEQRDVKGLYKKARAGALKNFTGIDSPYEPPLNPDIRVNTTQMSAPEAAQYIVNQLFGL